MSLLSVRRAHRLRQRVQWTVRSRKRPVKVQGHRRRCRAGSTRPRPPFLADPWVAHRTNFPARCERWPRHDRCPPSWLGLRRVRRRRRPSATPWCHRTEVRTPTTNQSRQNLFRDPPPCATPTRPGRNARPLQPRIPFRGAVSTREGRREGPDVEKPSDPSHIATVPPQDDVEPCRGHEDPCAGSLLRRAPW